MYDCSITRGWVDLLACAHRPKSLVYRKEEYFAANLLYNKKISIVIKAPGYDYIGGQSIFVEGITDDGKRISGNMGILVHLTREQAEQKQKEIEQ